MLAFGGVAWKMQNMPLEFELLKKHVGWKQKKVRLCRTVMMLGFPSPLKTSSLIVQQVKFLPEGKGSSSLSSKKPSNVGDRIRATERTWKNKKARATVVVTLLVELKNHGESTCPPLTYPAPKIKSFKGLIKGNQGVNKPCLNKAIFLGEVC